MNSLEQLSGLRTISLTAISLLCVLLVFVIAQNGASSGLLKKPSVELRTSNTLITLPCPPDGQSASRSCPLTVDLRIALAAFAEGFNKRAVYSYSVTGGRIVGEDSNVTWDLNGVWPGSYTATVEVRDNQKHRASSFVTVAIKNCADCVISDFPCPTIVVVCYDEVKAGTPITCKVVVGPRTRSDRITYEWSVRNSNGEDLSGRISGRGTSISVPTNGLAGQTVYATVEVKGLDPSCGQTASNSTVVKR